MAQSRANGKGKKPAKKKAEWVYLDHADKLSYDQSLRPGVQIAKGNVKFRFEDFTLACDSAFFNQFQNTFQALGHVKMHRGTGNINLTCARANYNSMTRIFQARQNVVMTQPGSSLHCDSLDYNSNTHAANYEGHGRLVANGTTVTSQKGEYNTKTHDSHFTGERVYLHSPEYNITTPDLSYNTQTKQGHVQGKSVIRTRDHEVVHTDNADFNGYSHSFTTHGHSTITSPERDIEGDNMDYDQATGRGEGHGHVRVNDKQGGRIITGDNVKFRTVPVVKNHRTRNEVVEFEGDGNSKIIDKPGQRTIKGDYLRYNAQTQEGFGEGNVDYIDHKQKNAFLGDYVHYTPLDAIAYGRAICKEFSRGDTLFVHADTLLMKGHVVDKEINGRTVQDTLRTFYGIDNVRAFRTDAQAVCGLLMAYTADSSMTMYQDPIVWSGQRQLLGDSIRCFMNDSTIREAHVMGNALSIELLQDGEHYNQVSSKEMTGYFTDGKIDWGEAFGNVLTAYYIIDDKDSSYYGFNYLETDTMRYFMTKTEPRKLAKIWAPKSDAMMYPMNQIPPDKLYLKGFAWFDDIRPISKYDLFRHADKGDKKLKGSVKERPPLQYVSTSSHPSEEPKDSKTGAAASAKSASPKSASASKSASLASTKPASASKSAAPASTTTVTTSDGHKRQIIYPSSDSSERQGKETNK